MSSSSRLDNRLKMCADFVSSGSKIADIGTDHAYLPVWLCRNGICPSAVAADINPEPLSKGAQTVKAARLEDKIQTRLSDGLEAVKADEADEIIIAGMGGELIADIIMRCGYAREKRFILQPMTRSEELIKRLSQNGYTILRQDCCVASGKCYTVLLAQYMGDFSERDESCFYLGKLSPRENPLHKRFVSAHIERLKKKARSDSRYLELAKKLEAAVGESEE